MYLAHINKENVQTTQTHLFETADLCELFGQKVGCANISKLTGILHDLGKLTDKFNNYLKYSFNNPKDNSLKGTVIHSTQGAQYINRRFGADGAKERYLSSIISLVVMSHHGGLVDAISPDGNSPFCNRLADSNEKLCYEEAVKNFESLMNNNINYSIDSVFDKALNEFSNIVNLCKEKGISCNFTLHLIIKYIFSCLIDADRLNTYQFMENLPTKTNEQPIPPWGELSWDKLCSTLDVYLENKKLKSCESEINKMRNNILNECRDFAKRPVGIYELTVPTGGGKTFSSLSFALEHAKIHKKDRIIYIIPYTGIIDQNAIEIKKALGREDIVFEHHSNITSDNDNLDEYDILSERYEYPIILTTMVQFLNIIYGKKTGDTRKLHNLANSVLIFDEIQSTPLNCIHLLNSCLNFLNIVCKSTILLCTATQPQLSKVDRKIILTQPVSIVRNLEEVFFNFRRVSVKDICLNGGYSHNELKNIVFEKLLKEASVLIILNTKKDAECLFAEINTHNDELPEGDKYYLYHLSTNMCPAHRKEIFTQMKERLNTGRVICISTQLIEAGIDISFPCVFRALAGLDSIAQAAGRCNRHGESSLCKEVYIFNVSGENIKKLPSIKTGQEATKRLLEEFKNNPESLGSDLLSPKAMERFYSYYFHENKNIMDYPIPQLDNATIYDLLNENKHSEGAFRNNNTQNIKPILKQAFETASKYFHVIDSNTRAVIIPYGETGRKLIVDLNRESSLTERKKLLKQAQQYSVNVFEWLLNSLNNEEALIPLSSGVLALKEEYYNLQTGITLNSKQMELMEY